MEFKYEMEGFNEMERALNALPERMNKRVVQGAVRRGAKVIQSEVVAGAPVGTEPPHSKYGRLHENIGIKLERAEKGFARFAVHNGRAFWASFLEFGTVKMAARPFFRPAFDRSAEGAIKEIIESMIKGLEREAKKLAADFKTAKRAIGNSRFK